METNDLLQQCQAGDETAIETLVNQYQREVTLLALSILDDADTPPGELSAEAEEAAQDAFLAALRALPGYRGEAAFKTWLFSITINVCRNRMRKRRALRRLKHALEGWLRPAAAAPSAGPAAAQMEERVINRERASALWLAVCALGEKHRLPVILRYYHDLPVAEIAALLKVSEGTVHSRLFTARERLRIDLEQSGAVDRAGPPGKAAGPGDRNQPLFSTAAADAESVALTGQASALAGHAEALASQATTLAGQVEALANQAEEPHSALLKRRRL